LPYRDPFVLSAFPERDDPRDALVAPRREDVREPAAGRAGRHQLAAARCTAARGTPPTCRFVPVRGNVQTRLARATGATVVRSGVESRPVEGDPQGLLDAVVLALAGLRRLGLESQVTEVLALELSLPAAGQGALAIEAVRRNLQVMQPPLRSTTKRPPFACAPSARCWAGSPAAARCRLPRTRCWKASSSGCVRSSEGRMAAAESRWCGRRGVDPHWTRNRWGQSVGEALLDAGGGMLLEAARSQAQGLPAPKRA